MLLIMRHVTDPRTQEGAATYGFIVGYLSRVIVIFVQPYQKYLDNLYTRFLLFELT